MKILRLIIIIALIIIFLPFGLARILVALASDPKTRNEMVNESEELWEVQCRWIKTGNFEE